MSLSERWAYVGDLSFRVISLNLSRRKILIPILYSARVDSRSLWFVLTSSIKERARMLSLADPETKDDPHFDNQKEESFPVGPNYLAETVSVVKADQARSDHSSIY